MSMHPYVHRCAIAVNDLALIEQRQALALPPFLQPADNHLRDIGLLVERLLVEGAPNVRLQSQCQPDRLPCPASFPFTLRLSRGFLPNNVADTRASFSSHNCLLIHFHSVLISSAALPSSSNSVTANPLDNARAKAVRCASIVGATVCPWAVSASRTSATSRPRGFTALNTTTNGRPTACAILNATSDASRSGIVQCNGMTIRSASAARRPMSPSARGGVSTITRSHLPLDAMLLPAS